MKTKFTIFLLIVFINLFSQSEFKLHINARNAKESNLTDYYGKYTMKFNIDSFYVISTMVNYERDNGIIYYSYSGSFAIDYGNIEYYKDTEKNIEYFSSAVFYPITKWFCIGYNYMYSDDSYHLINTTIKYKWVFLDLSFFENVEKLKISVNPEYLISPNLSTGIDCELLYVLNKLKWHSGFTIKYTLFAKPK